MRPLRRKDSPKESCYFGCPSCFGAGAGLAGAAFVLGGAVVCAGAVGVACTGVLVLVCTGALVLVCTGALVLLCGAYAVLAGLPALTAPCETAGAVCASAARGLDAARFAGCPPLFFTYEVLSAWAEFICCV